MNILVILTWLQARLECGERGATMVEYGLLLALLVLVAMVGVRVFGLSVSSQFSSIGSNVG